METNQYRPRSVSELIDAAIRIVRNNFAGMLTLAVAAYLPLVAWFAAMPLFFQEEDPARIVVMLILVAAAGLWFLVFDAMIVHAAGEAYLGDTASPARSARHVLGRVLSVIGASFLRVAVIFLPAVGAGVAAAIVPGPIAAILIIAAIAVVMVVFFRLILIPATVVLEDGGSVAGLSRSWALTEGGLWHIFKAFMLIYLIMSAIGLVFYGVIMLVLAGNPVAATALGQLGFALPHPLYSTVTTLLYYDFRIRKEGYDIELMAQAITSEAPRPART
ncbi:MAG TPA: hypothetical protein VMM18_13030 [Gemmatimonadaceae bacterium]|nr:hypothetical protein [Gemmatimonadaceae bacterium]